MYWILTNEIADEDNDADLNGIFKTNYGDDISFDNGEALNSDIKNITYTLTEPLNGNLTDHISIDEIPGLVFSERLCALLYNMMVPNIQMFPLEIIDPKSKEKYKDYKIANVVGLVSCIDENKSDLDYFDDGDIEFINKLVLKESKVPSDLDIFRLRERPTLVIVSDVLKTAIEGSGMTGCVFAKPEDYH